MFPESVLKKLTEEEQLAIIADLEQNNKILQEKNDIIDTHL